MHNTEGVVILDSPFAAQLEQGFRRLRFTVPGVEQTFRAEYAEQNLPRMRTGFLLASGLYLIFLLVRVLAESGPAATLGFLVRCTIIGAMLLTVVVSYTHARRGLVPLIFASYAVFGGGVTAIELIGHHYGIDRHYEGMIFVTIHAYVLSGLVFRQAFSAALLIFVFYAVGGWFGGLAGKAWGYELFFIGLLNMLGAVALYLLESVERDNFLRKHLLKEMAGHDGLTGLYNRSAFLDHFGRALKQAAREQRTLGLLMLDLDYFKQYNDLYGHLEGDVSLRRVALTVRNEFRRPLDLFARYGGEEFIGLWYDIEPASLERLARTVRDEVAAMVIPHEGSPCEKITVTVGAIAFRPKGGESLLALIRQADAAMYEAKASGRNGVVTRVAFGGQAMPLAWSA